MVGSRCRYISSMPSDVALELIGCAGSALVVVLVATRLIITFRFLDLAGSVVIPVNEPRIGSLPIILTRVPIVGADRGMGFARATDSVQLATARAA